MLLGGRAADLLGRRRVLVAGTFVFGASSLAGGLAQNSGTVIGSRLAQGIGAAMMLPAALSILTTTFRDGPERYKALGAWGGMAGLGSAAGVLLGGLLTQGPGWRWVFLVKPPLVASVVAGAFILLADGRRRGRAGPLSPPRVPGRGPRGWSAPPPWAGARPARSERSPGPLPCWPRSWSTSSAARTRCCRCRYSASKGWPPPTSRSSSALPACSQC